MSLLRLAASSAFAPLILFGCALAATSLLRLHRLRMRWAWPSAVLIAALTAAALAYLALPVLFEDAETAIACTAALAARGAAIYPGPEAVGRYALLYGPMTYLAHIPFYALLGASLFSFKLPGVLAFLITLASLYGIARKYAPPRAALIGVGCASVVLFRYFGVGFWGRIDPLIVAAVALCVWALEAAPDAIAVVVAALTFAFVPNLKISGVAYLLPLAGYLLVRRGWRLTLAACGLAMALVALPFLLPQVSLRNYMAILRTASEHGLVLEFLIRNVQYSALLLAPVFAPGRRTRNQTIYFGLIAAGLAITSVLGAKSGAGSYHLLPFLAPLLHAYFWIRADRTGPDPDRGFARFALAWVAVTLLLSTAHLGQGIRTFRGAREGRAIVAEIRGFERARAGESMEVGVGAGFLDQRESYGYLTTFAGGPYTIAGAAIRDFQFGGIPIPPATLRYMAACGTQDWLIPKGEQPFSALNPYYDEPHPAFDDAFRQTFLEHYRKADAGRWYDLWTCGSGK